MVRPGVLPPAAAGQFISNNAQHVKIHEEGLEKLRQEILSSMSANKLQIPEVGTDIALPSRDSPRAADWLLVADALNFCFWSYSGDQKWTVDGHSGYYALEAALSRALKEGYDITNPEYYSKITEQELGAIMRSDNEAQIPLLSERVAILREVGAVLLDKYRGTFVTCLEEANKSAVKLLEIIVVNFPSFRDEATYGGQKVSLYKRAQILVADVWNFFDGTGLGEFRDIDKITMFADYRVPQVLLHFGALSYSEQLMNKLKHDILLPSGSQEEVEIRGCSIHCVELLRRRLQPLAAPAPAAPPAAPPAGPTPAAPPAAPPAGLLDYYLWCYRRKHADQMEAIPFHKTLGIYY